MTDDTKGNRGDRLVIDDPHSVFASGGYVGRDGDAVMGWDLAGNLSGGRCCLVLNGGSARHREILDLINASGKDVDVVVVDGTEHSREDVYVRWDPAKDDRIRPAHDTFPPIAWPEAPEPPPFHLGRFNCRGDYVWPGMPEAERPLTLMRQSGGQIAEALTDFIPGEALGREAPHWAAALTKGIVNTVLRAARGVEGFSPSQLIRNEAGPDKPSKRRARRLRGKARALRRWQYRP